jgi:hypothetical protein
MSLMTGSMTAPRGVPLPASHASRLEILLENVHSILCLSFQFNFLVRDLIGDLILIEASSLRGLLRIFRLATWTIVNIGASSTT